MQQVPQCYYPQPQYGMPQYPYGMQPQYNAVKIDIINPQAMPAPMGPYNYPQANIYQPGQPVPYPYQPQMAPANVVVPPMVATAPTVPQAPQQLPAPVVVPQQPQTTVPVPQAPMAAPMPQPVAVMPQPIPVAPTAPQTPVVPAPAATPQAPAAAPQTPTAAAPATPEVKTPETLVAETVNNINNQLKSNDIETQFKGLNEVLNVCQNDPKKALDLADVSVMTNLLEILDKDTSSLEGATPERTAIRQKIINGEKVTPQEEAEANIMSPLEAAERNKQLSIVAIALLQKAAVDEVEKTTGNKVNITQIPCIEQIVETAKSNPNPILRATSIEALSQLSRPEYKQVLGQIFDLARQDQDLMVQGVATTAFENIAKM